MPISLPPVSRRRFLGSALVAAVGLAVSGRIGRAADQPDADVLALLSDTHINADADRVDFDVNMADHLSQAVREILAESNKPAAVLFNGDCAHRVGQPGDYAQLLNLVKPLRDNGLPLHLAMGNHDHREHFWAAFGDNDPARQAVTDRQVLLLEFPHADWILLDTLDVVDATPGTMGPAQLDWLRATLDARKSDGKPIIVMLHHHPQLPTPPAGQKPATQPVVFPGLTDSDALMDLLLPNKQVKLVLFGHTHLWHQGELDGLHFINLPAVSYIFDRKQPSAWAMCNVGEGGANLEIHALNKTHPLNGKQIQLAWR